VVCCWELLVLVAFPIFFSNYEINVKVPYPITCQNVHYPGHLYKNWTGLRVKLHVVLVTLEP
jgi:hypothetical protein